MVHPAIAPTAALRFEFLLTRQLQGLVSTAEQNFSMRMYVPHCIFVTFCAQPLPPLYFCNILRMYDGVQKLLGTQD
jgi:hypothetical protein